MNKIAKRPSLFISLLPMLLLVVLISLNALLASDDMLAGANQLALLTATGLALLLALRCGVSAKRLHEGAIKTLSGALSPIIILLMIGILAGSWMLSGIIPTMIYYGLYILHPAYFLPATLIISAIISVTTGSSWSTIATIGIALMGIGKALGFSDPMIAGAIISGAYFGDKISPMSDTTNLAAATVGIDLFRHIRYMQYTTVPSFVIALLLFGGLSLFTTPDEAAVSVKEVQASIAQTFRITPLLFIVPIAVIFLIIKRIAAAPVLFIGGLLGGVAALLFQTDLVTALSGEMHLTAEGAYRVITRSMYGAQQIETGDPSLNSLFSSKGMAGMLNTVWLIITAMLFGGAMEAGGFLERIAQAMISRIRSNGGIVAANAATCVLFNATAADQYMSIVVPGKMFAPAYRKNGMAPEVLSRTLEDSATATSPLIPWNTCGATQSGVLGVATMSYLPFAFFCYLSPLMTILMASLNINIRRIPAEEGAQNEKNELPLPS